MTSSAADRLQVTYEAYQKAFHERAGDLKDATTLEQVQKILANVTALELEYLKAAQDGLDGNTQAIEDAYDAAVAAKKAVDDAYKDEKALADRIRLVGGLATKVGELVTRASGP